MKMRSCLASFPLKRPSSKTKAGMGVLGITLLWPPPGKQGRVINVDHSQKPYLNDPELEKLQWYEESRRKEFLPPDIKPCVLNLLRGNLSRLSRNNTAFWVAIELKRVGRSLKQIEGTLTARQVHPTAVRGIVRSLTKRDYKCTCNKLDELGICPYERQRDCGWYQEIPRSRKSEEWHFWRYGWPTRLSAVEMAVYLAIVWLERRRGYHQGSRLFVSRRQLKEASGRSEYSIAHSLNSLSGKGLIRLKKGMSGKYWHRGAEITRIWPIPKPQK